jgi:hypothetical protein
MKKFYISWFVILLFGLGGCSQSTVSLNLALENPLNIQGSTPVVGGEFMVEDVEASLIEMEPHYCLDCHIDQQMLIDTAKPEEVVISENEGEG